MMPTLFRLFLTLSSLALTLAIFAANKGYAVLNQLDPVFRSWSFTKDWLVLKGCPHWVSYVLYFLAALLVVCISLWLARFLSTDSIAEKSIASVEPANDAYLPSYLGYFFVALGITNLEVFLYVFGVICLFTFCSRAAYFNPMLFVLGYQFYNAENTSGCKVLIITKQNLKNPETVYFDKIYRINDVTYIDLKGAR